MGEGGGIIGVLTKLKEGSTVILIRFPGRNGACLVFAPRFRALHGEVSIVPRFRLVFRPRIQAFSFPSPRVRLALAAISRSRRMGKQSEAPKIGDAEKKHLREEVSL